MDPLTLLMYFSKYQLAFISKRENASMFIVGKLMHKLMCQMINRENDREALKTILTCIRLIKEDEVSIGVFPEGYTSMDGLLHPFRSGVFKIAQKANVPIVVCTLRDTQYALKNAMKLKRSVVELRLLDVIPAEDLKGRTAVDIGSIYLLRAGFFTGLYHHIDFFSDHTASFVIQIAAGAGLVLGNNTADTFNINHYIYIHPDTLLY
jgi:1-acyl-sn-glycerol-3-phosphate acyltransferase